MIKFIGLLAIGWMIGAFIKEAKMNGSHEEFMAGYNRTVGEKEITDTDRLEWMWKNNIGNCKLYKQGNRYCIYMNRFADSKWFDTPREAIDDAMKAGK